MKIIFLSTENLRNTMFIKDLVWNLKGSGKCILVHDHFGSISDTRFVTKRLSSLFSEELIPTVAFSGDQKRLLQQAEGDIFSLQLPTVFELFETVDLVILNAIGIGPGEEAQQFPASIWVNALRQYEEVEGVYVFSKNARSPLVAQPRMIHSEEDVASLREAYPEESIAMDLAVQFAPCLLAAPSNFKQAITAQP